MSDLSLRCLRSHYAWQRLFAGCLSIFLCGFLQHIGSAQGNFAVENFGSVATPEDTQQLRLLEQRVQSAIAQVLPSVVAIRQDDTKVGQPRSPRDSSFASGVLISESGLILSQYHVSHQGQYDDAIGLVRYRQPGDKVDVVLADGRCLQARLLGGERLADISLLQMCEPGPFPPVPLAVDDTLSLGEWVIKLGHPLGYQADRGSCARLGRVAYINSANILPDCLIAGGDSGGPLINLQGEVVGLPQDSYIPRDTWMLLSSPTISMSYMPANKIRRKIPEMLESKVPHETAFEDHQERRLAYGKVQVSLAKPELRSADRMQDAWQAIATSTGRSVVEIVGEAEGRRGLGTVVSDDGYVIAKASTTPQYPSIRLPDGQRLAAKTIGTDATLDIALLKCESRKLVAVTWNSAQAVRGALVMTKETGSNATGVGIVGASNHPIALAIEGETFIRLRLPTVFEHDCPLGDQAYGGPLFNLRGEAIGVTIASAGPHGYLAIPAEDLLRCIKRLRFPDAS